MVDKLRRHFAANVVGYIALVVALIGVPMAWAALGKNTVGTKQIKPNAVRSSDVKNDSLTGFDVLESSFGAVPSAQTAVNAQQAQNAATADSAGTAQSAQSAQNATNATNAQNATNATNAQNANNAGFASSANNAFNADNANNLGGFGLSQFAGIGRESTTFGCDADVISPDGCIGDVPITLPRSGRVLGILTGTAIAFNVNDPDTGADDVTFVNGHCELSADTAGNITQTQFTKLFTTGTKTSIASIGVSASLSAGVHNFNVTCTENDGDIDWENLKFAIVLLGSG
jgi:hypothetical protein